MRKYNTLILLMANILFLSSCSITQHGNNLSNIRNPLSIHLFTKQILISSIKCDDKITHFDSQKPIFSKIESHGIRKFNRNEHRILVNSIKSVPENAIEIITKKTVLKRFNAGLNYYYSSKEQNQKAKKSRLYLLLISVLCIVGVIIIFPIAFMAFGSYLARTLFIIMLGLLAGAVISFVFWI